VNHGVAFGAVTRGRKNERTYRSTDDSAHRCHSRAKRNAASSPNCWSRAKSRKRHSKNGIVKPDRNRCQSGYRKRSLLERRRRPMVDTAARRRLVRSLELVALATEEIDHMTEPTWRRLELFRRRVECRVEKRVDPDELAAPPTRDF